MSNFNNFEFHSFIINACRKTEAVLIRTLKLSCGQKQKAETRMRQNPEAEPLSGQNQKAEADAVRTLNLSPVQNQKAEMSKPES